MGPFIFSSSTVHVMGVFNKDTGKIELFVCYQRKNIVFVYRCY